MLKPDIKETLLAIKFREEMFEVLDAIAADYASRLLISQNLFQKESRFNKPFGLVFTVPHAQVETVTEKLKTKLPANYNLYELDILADTLEIAVVRPTDKYELLRIMGTNAEAKHDLDTGTLVARLRRWEEDLGLTIMGAGNDWVKFKIERIPGNLREFSNEIIEFAPISFTDVKAFEQELQKNHTVMLRW